MVVATQLRRGMVIKMDNELYVITGTEHITPGNWRGMVQSEMRSVKSNRKLQKRFRSTEDVEEVYVDIKNCEFIFPEGDDYIFMDLVTFEQFPISKEFLGDAPQFMPLNSQVRVTICEEKPIGVELPPSVILEVVDTEPGAKGDTHTNVFKAAKVQTGATIKVPLYIKKGEKVKVDTRTGEFLERA
ncbi:MAG: elongation factor P [Planctomycetota bacterium]